MNQQMLQKKIKNESDLAKLSSLQVSRLEKSLSTLVIKMNWLKTNLGNKAQGKINSLTGIYRTLNIPENLSVDFIKYFRHQVYFIILELLFDNYYYSSNTYLKEKGNNISKYLSSKLKIPANHVRVKNLNKYQAINALAKDLGGLKIEESENKLINLINHLQNESSIKTLEINIHSNTAYFGLNGSFVDFLLWDYFGKDFPLYTVILPVKNQAKDNLQPSGMNHRVSMYIFLFDKHQSILKQKYFESKKKKQKISNYNFSGLLKMIKFN
jgi:hypothetical protein